MRFSSKQMVAGLNQLKPSLDEAGVALVAVGIGTAAQAGAFLKHTNYIGELWIDTNEKGKSEMGKGCYNDVLFQIVRAKIATPLRRMVHSVLIAQQLTGNF